MLQINILLRIFLLLREAVVGFNQLVELIYCLNQTRFRDSALCVRSLVKGVVQVRLSLVAGSLLIVCLGLAVAWFDFLGLVLELSLIQIVD